MKKLKIILSVFIIILLGVGASFCLKNEDVSEIKKDESNNEIINSTIIEVAKEEPLNEVENTLFITEEQKNTHNIIENKVISETKLLKKQKKLFLKKRL